MKANRVLLVALIGVIATGCVTAQVGGPDIRDGYGSTIGCYRGVANPQRPGGAHPGIDLRGQRGTPVMAAAPGIVDHIWRGKENEYGVGVAIKHDTPIGIRWTVSLHMQNINVKRGDRVVRGQVIGEVAEVPMNNCDPHLHFEVCTTRCGGYGHYDGDLRGTDNPEKYLVGCYNAGEAEEKYRALVSAKLPLALTSPVSSCPQR